MKKQLNPEQEAAVLHTDGPLRLGAVAGAGKTTALIEKVAYLIEKKHVSPGRILMISFSRAARDEMKHRIDKRLPAAGAGKCARTFHSIGLMIFQREIDPERKWAMDTSGYMYIRAAQIAYKSMGMKPEKKAIVRFAEMVKNDLVGADEVMRRLGKVDPRMAEYAHEAARGGKVAPMDLLAAYNKTETIRTGPGIDFKGQQRRFVTFNDMIYETARLLRRSDVRNRWGDMWSYVLQDEAQDENEAQAVIAEALAGKHRNYTIVGDPAQSVYAFRGAKPEKMVEFDARWPGAKTIIMHRNYRSGIEIVDLANRLIEHMPAHTVITDPFGDIVPMTSERKTHAYIGYHTFADARAEAEAVASNIVEHIRLGTPKREQAVLMRMNRMTRDIEISLATRAIPYRLISGTSFFLLKESRVLFGYLRILLCRADVDDFKAVLNNPSRKLGKAFVQKVAEIHDMVKKDWLESTEKTIPKLSGYQLQAAREWLQWMKGMRKRTGDDADPKMVLKKICFGLGLDEWFARETDDEEDNRSGENIGAIMDFASHFTSLKRMMDVVDNVEKHRSASARKKDAVTLTTVHKAKGGEWSVVYLIEASDGLFPNSNADVHEERRCFYVACTRAKDELWISRAEFDENDAEQQDSLFIEEANIVRSETYEKGVRIDLKKVGTQIGLNL